MTTYYYPSNYGAGEAASSVSSAGTQTFTGTEQEPAGSYTAITPLGNTGPNNELQYSVTFDYTGPNTGTTITTTQTAYSDSTASESFGYFPVTTNGTTTLYPTYFILTDGPVTVPYTHTFAAAGSPSTTAFSAEGVPTTDPTVCFASGTLIALLRGEVAVEELAVGDLVITSDGRHRAIRWIGHRSIDCSRHPRPHEVMPIRIAAHAFGEGRPARDLFVSPGHAICIDVFGEVLIPAALLINGSTIQQVEVDEITYWHVELDSHDIILAENLPAESYLDMGNRGFFREVDVVDLAAGPDADPSRRTHADFCRPFHDGGAFVEVVRAQLHKRAEESGWTLTRDLELHLVIDGRRVDPHVRGMTARFEIPAGAEEVWLVSPTARPCDTWRTGDRRELGLDIAALRIDDGFRTRDIALDGELLCNGFHAVEEGARRWTSGRAKLPAALWYYCKEDFYLRVELAGLPVPRWVAPVAAAVATERPQLAIIAR